LLVVFTSIDCNWHFFNKLGRLGSMGVYHFLWVWLCKVTPQDTSPSC
jgi:hypothetical protein